MEEDGWRALSTYDTLYEKVCKADELASIEAIVVPSKIGNAIDPKREELLRLVGEFGKEVFKASMTNPQSIEMIAKLDSEGLANVFSVMARDSTALAAAIIAEVDRVSGGKP